MANFNKVNDFVKNAVESINLGSDQFVIALSNTPPENEAQNPVSDGNGILANVSEISYANISSRNITTTSSSQENGTYKLVLADLVMSSNGGQTGPFRYIYIYDDTPNSPENPLIGYYDYGSNITLADSDTFTVDFSQANGVLQLS